MIISCFVCVCLPVSFSMLAAETRLSPDLLFNYRVAKRLIIIMGKSCKVVVCGLAAVGKTAVLEQLLYANHIAGSEPMETLEDIYIGSIETDRGTREQVRFYDTRGLRDGLEFPRHYFSFADGFVLVYSIDSKESFKRMEALKKDIDRFRDKKEVTIVVLGNKLDMQEQRNVDSEVAQHWAKTEKVRLWEVSVADRRTLIEPFVHLASKMTQPQSKSSFPLSRNKNKGSGSVDS
ncbi:NF-kappa-B inhibitor-interacting Ras-like protein 2 isoform X1 [Oncorhynchus tshawytscha]|uniref:NF-kappa-B inhibitor-interacting Ras-like protein 2 isoform X1 n=1 Tax=Oncorhynchus tshawytscha TaxID=74940 RepID=UPI000D0A5637|nr:NF-kappa-B inhibitor-interacting Ras-like protein 2 isoform X1 [Oncorhynchus tshawytscha]